MKKEGDKSLSSQHAARAESDGDEVPVYSIIAFFKSRMRAGWNPVSIRILLSIFLRVTHKKNRITLWWGHVIPTKKIVYL